MTGVREAGARVPRPADARRELAARALRRPAWIAGAAALAVAAGLLAIPQAHRLARLLDHVLVRGATLADLRAPLLPLAALVALRAAAMGASSWAGGRAADAAARRLRADVAARLLGRGPLELERDAAGALAALASEGAVRVGPFAGRVLPQVAVAAVVPTAIALYAVTVDPWSGLILLVTGPLVPLFMALLGSLAERRAQRQWRALERLSAHLLDALQGLETLRLFGRARDHERAVEAAGEAHRATTLATLRVAFLSGFALELLAMLGTAMVAVAVGLRLAEDALPFVVALEVLLLAPEFYAPLRGLGARHHAGMEGVAAARGLMASLGPDALRDPPRPVPADAPAAPAGAAAPGPHPARVRGTTKDVARTPPEIELHDVWARYPGGSGDALEGIDARLGPGGITAVVGASGAGKTTLVRVLIGMVPPRRGALRVDGAPVDPSSEAWRARVAWVPQHPHLFAGSVLDNLRLGRPDAPLEAVVAAARAAEIDGVLAALPQGYATPLGEDGHGLSGGERHRLAIARALVRDAEVVVLDEPAAYLDARTEAALGRSLARLATGRSVVIVAHRPATARAADRVIVLDGGRVVEHGTPAALANAGGPYAALCGPDAAPWGDLAVADGSAA